MGLKSSNSYIIIKYYISVYKKTAGILVQQAHVCILSFLPSSFVSPNFIELFGPSPTAVKANN